VSQKHFSSEAIEAIETECPVCFGILKADTFACGETSVFYDKLPDDPKICQRCREEADSNEVVPDSIDVSHTMLCQMASVLPDGMA
jgi:hypothetical protein